MTFLVLVSFLLLASSIRHACCLKCKMTTLGQDYDGEITNTISGKPCQHWNSNKRPHPIPLNIRKNYGDQENYCRNPLGRPEGPWCYTVDPKVTWEYCDVPACPNWSHNIGLAQKDWGMLYPDCNGLEQSPINIMTSKVKYNALLPDFNFDDLHNYKNVRMKLKNDGHTIQVDFSGRKMKVNGGGLPGTFLIEQLHFHWGSKSSTGSEHKLNNRQTAMELHVMMYSDIYKSMGDAAKVTAGLAVLGFLVNVGKHNSSYDPIVNNLKSVQNKGDSVPITTFDVTTLFPSTSRFFRYYGSLTTPSCKEGVIWTVFQPLMTLSNAQLAEFRKLGPKKQDSLWNNWRHTQPLNWRVVTSNFRP